MSSSCHESDSMVGLLLLFFAMQLRKWNSRGTAVSDAAGRREQQRHKRKHLAFDRFYSRSVLPTSVKAAAPSIDQRPSPQSPVGMCDPAPSAMVAIADSLQVASSVKRKTRTPLSPLHKVDFDTGSSVTGAATTS